jgi:hypothetical protein
LNSSQGITVDHVSGSQAIAQIEEVTGGFLLQRSWWDTSFPCECV